MSPAGLCGFGGRQRLAGHGLPALSEMIRDVGDARPAQHTEGVMPADVVPRDVRRGVEAIAGIRRQVDAADERDLIVDDDELLVVTVQRALLRVGCELDLGAGRERMTNAVDVVPVRTEEGQWRSGPRQQPNRNLLGQAGQQLA